MIISVNKSYEVKYRVDVELTKSENALTLCGASLIQMILNDISHCDIKSIQVENGLIKIEDNNNNVVYTYEITG